MTIIGRHEQLQEICRQIDAVIAGSAAQNVLFVTGEAGIGKSTLLRAVQADCGKMPQPPVVALTECSTPLAGQDIGEVEALVPWAEIMRQLAVGEQEKKLQTRRLVGELAMAWVRCIPVVGDVLESVSDTAHIIKEHQRSGQSLPLPAYAANQQQLFQQYINFLAKLSEHTPLVLMIDDFHWADTSSTNLLFAAARQLQEKPVLFVIAYRADDAQSSRGGEGHPLLHIRRELERYSLAAEIGVPKMTPLDMDRLLRNRYRNYQNNDGFEEWLAHVSGGNALFITQFLNTLEEDGYIDRTAGAIRKGYETASIPRSAYAVVQQRIQRLNEDTKEILRYASVEGDEFTTLVLARITELPQLKLLQKLRLVEETHRVISNVGKQRVYASETTAYRFSHALIHKAMYESLLEEERELLHGAILDVLQEEWEAAKKTGINLPGIAARLSVHAEILGKHLLAAEILLDGARASWKEFAEEETLRQIEGALLCIGLYETDGTDTNGKPDQESMRLRAEMLMVRGKVHAVRGRYNVALTDYLHARQLFEEAGEHQRAIDARLNEAIALRVRGEYAAAQSHAEFALDYARSTGSTRYIGGALNAIGNNYYIQGDGDRALDYFRQSLEIFEQLGEQEAVAKLIGNIGNIHRQRGEIEKARDCYRQSLDLTEAVGDRIAQAIAILHLGNIEFELEEYSTALWLYQQCLELAERIGHRETSVKAMGNIGALQRELGNWEEGRTMLRQVVAIAREMGSKDTEADVLWELGVLEQREAESLQGAERQRHLEAAIGHLEESLAICREINRVDLATYEQVIELVKEQMLQE